MNDLIDRKKLITDIETAILLQKSIAEFFRFEDDPVIKAEIQAYTDILNGVKDEPSVDVPDRKVGKWIRRKDGSATCSECNMHQKAIWDDDGWQQYCGCCGAKMDGME